jgi:hypothetical protein
MNYLLLFLSIPIIGFVDYILFRKLTKCEKCGNEMAKWYSEQAQKSTGNEKKEFERQAWIDGVKVYALLNDLEKRILKAIKS